MNGRLEKPFVVDGVKYGIECIEFNVENPQRESVFSYHYHDYIELLYALSPGAVVWINQKCHKFNVGNLAVINSRELHTLTFEGNAKYICVKFSPQILYSDEQALSEFKYLAPFIIESSGQKIFTGKELPNVDTTGLFLEIMDEWQTKRTGYELIIRANVLKLFASIFRYWQENNNYNTENQLTEGIKKALTYIAENYNIVTEREVAEISGLSYNHFSYSFKKIIGKSFSAYLNSIKIKEAEKLLLSKEMNVTEIAFHTGFSSASHFISRFREINKITPKQFRNKILQEKNFLTNK